MSALARKIQTATRLARGGAGVDSPADEATGWIARIGGSGGVLVSIAAAEDVPHSQREDAQIEPQRPVVDVVQVILYPLAQVAAAAQVVDLSPTRDPRLHHVLLHVAWNFLPELRDELRSLWSWTDQRHVAVKDVEKLWKLVEAVAAKQRAEPRCARIGFVRPHRSAGTLRSNRHRPEFEHGKASSVPRQI